jgi:hypothetical protein
LKITVQVPAVRGENDVDITLSLGDDGNTLNVKVPGGQPRQPAVDFNIDINELDNGVQTLHAANGATTDQAAGGDHSSGADDDAE